jgi:two-component system, NtrC family, sensor kinase
MSLRSKIVLIVTLVVAFYAIVDHLLQRRMLLPSFAELERLEAVEDVSRTVRAVQAEIDHLDQACRDRASWDETYEFAGEADQAQAARYVSANLGTRALAQDELDLLYLCDAEGRVLWSEARDWRSGVEFSLRDLPRQRLARNHAYLVSQNVPRGHEPQAQRGYVAGLVQTEHGPMLLALRPVLPSSGSGEVRGTLILGRLLNQALVRELSERTRVDFELWPLDGRDLPDAESAILPQVTSTSAPQVVERGDDFLDVYTTLSDMRAAPALLVRARVARDIWTRGSGAVRYALISTLAAGLLLLLVLLGALQRTVLTPIAKLTDYALYIGQTEDSTTKLELVQDRKDELGVLGREFDSMLSKLAKSRAAVVDTARQAGMSEIANGILHNVGNVLNSVNVSAGLVAEKLRTSKVPKLERLTSLADAHAGDLGAFLTNDPKGKHFAPYLSELSRLMRTDQEELQREVVVLNDGIEHIRRLVSSQQAYAGKSGLREPTRLEQEIVQALEISARAAEGQPPIEVLEAYEELPTLRLDRHKLMEILVNVLKNAREALAPIEGARKVRISIAKRLDPDGKPQVALEIADNGGGIDPQNLSKVFLHGFTTKPGGHGFGLHASAIAAKELGGALSVVSPGALGGATFVLVLPMEPVAAPVANAVRI